MRPVRREGRVVIARCGSPACRRARPDSSCSCECGGQQHGVARVGGDRPDIEPAMEPDAVDLVEAVKP